MLELSSLNNLGQHFSMIAVRMCLHQTYFSILIDIFNKVKKKNAQRSVSVNTLRVLLKLSETDSPRTFPDTKGPTEHGTTICLPYIAHPRGSVSYVFEGLILRSKLLSRGLQYACHTHPTLGIWRPMPAIYTSLSQSLLQVGSTGGVIRGVFCIFFVFFFHALTLCAGWIWGCTGC